MKRELVVRLGRWGSLKFPPATNWKYETLPNGILVVRCDPDSVIVFAHGAWKSVEARTMGASI